ncbi:MAG TPA: glycosyltransferase family 39 protein, partial [Chloroflexota bacterium]|nr:glycosyltransferase family 39 protein [Chloroflexota bacterium]
MRVVAAAKLPRARAASGSLTLTLSRFGGRGNYANLPAVAAITLFAVAVRVLQLEFVNFHSDEAFFIQIAYQGTFMRSMSIDEPHPPLFLALLQAWMGPAGVTEYAIRLLPVLAGTLLVPLTYQLGRLLGSRRLGLAAAFAAAANPLFIFYAREVRDNGLMAFSGALSFVLLMLALRRPALLPAYIVAAMAALFSHYYNVAIVALQLAIGAAWLARRHKLRLWPWAAAPAILLAGYAPWLAFARSSIVNYDVGRGTPAVFLAGLTRTFQAFTVGFSIQTWIVLWACLAM